jgi:type I restriction-modification system DNA methylase subunit
MSEFSRVLEKSSRNVHASLEKRLWDVADQLRANSGLRSQECSAPVLGLIFLRFAEVRFSAQRAKVEKAEASSRRGTRVEVPAAYHAEGILYLPAPPRSMPNTTASTNTQLAQQQRQQYQVIGGEKAAVAGAGLVNAGSAQDILRSSAQQSGVHTKN